MNKPNISPGVTLGSLFDGIGGFPYAASFFGIKPLWASEIMPQAVSVTQRHLPDMEHVGDITLLDGAKLPPVDIITFGSPCQGLSMAGRRLGLADERSGLFSEAIRIIEEMREATNGKYPRYAVWENVPGALSSNSGLDYKAVLEAFAKAEVPIPRSGKWANSGMVRSDGIDLAWVVYNAQHFGVPQRRRRIFLVCDFSGRSAGEILFKPKSLSGYFAACREAGQNLADNASRGIDGASLPAGVKDTAATIFAGYGNHWNGNAGAYDGSHFALSPNPDAAVSDDSDNANAQTAGTLDANYGKGPGMRGGVEREVILCAPAPDCLNPWDTQQSRIFTEEGLSPTLAGADGGGGRNPAGLVIQGTDTIEETNPKSDTVKCAAFLGGASAQARSIGYSEKVAPTLKGEPCGFSAPCAVLNDQGGERFSVEKSELSPTLRSETHGNLPIVAIPDAPAVTMRLREGCDGGGKSPLLQQEKCGTLAASNGQYLFAPQIIEALPISTQIATRHNSLGEGTGFGVGEDGDPAYTLQQARSHAVGVHISYEGNINTADTAYSLTTNGTATGRNGPIIAHEKALGITAKGNGECFLMPECHYTLTHGGGQPGQGFPAALIQCAFSLDSDSSNSMKSGNPLSGCRAVETARTIDTTNPCPSKNQGGIAVMDVHPKICGTLVASGAGMNRPGRMASETDLCIVVPDEAVIPINDKATRCNGGGNTRGDDGSGNGLGIGKDGDPAPTITSGDRHAVAAYCLQGNMIGRQDHNGPRGNGINEELAFTLTATDVSGVTAPDGQPCQPYQEVIGALCNGDHKGIGNQYVSQNKCIVTKYLVRRLTPTECERLQGYPDGWTLYGHDGKEISDTRRYQMLGNSVAVPCVAYILQGIAEQFGLLTQ